MLIYCTVTVLNKCVIWIWIYRKSIFLSLSLQHYAVWRLKLIIPLLPYITSSLPVCSVYALRIVNNIIQSSLPWPFSISSFNMLPFCSILCTSIQIHPVYHSQFILWDFMNLTMSASLNNTLISNFIRIIQVNNFLSIFLSNSLSSSSFFFWTVQISPSYATKTI